MKVVINRCYGGFSISPYAVKRIAEIQGKECYFFKHNLKKGFDSVEYIPIDIDKAGKEFVWYAFDINNPNELFDRLTREERDKLYIEHSLDSRIKNRSDSLLIQIIEELKEMANGSYAELKIVEIPDGTDYEIEEYDGMEWVSETHRTWR